MNHQDSYPRVIAIGPFTPDESNALAEAFGAQLCASPADIASMEPEARHKVSVVAYKGGHPFTATEMDQLPALGLIANFGVGYDAIDVDAASARQIAVTNTPHVLNDDVADLAVALTLAQSRELAKGDRWVRSGQWAEGPMPLSRKMSGRPVGVLGLGNIGREIATRFEAFRMPVHYWSRTPKDTPEHWTYCQTPEQLAAAVDVLVIVVVGGPETEHMVGRNVLEALGPEGVLVNVSRGSTVDEQALIQALSSGRLGGAALDVFATEPEPDSRLLDLPNVVLYPHGGSATRETRSAMAELQRANIRAFFNDAPLITAV